MIMQNKALVTVFIPIYNVEKYINKCLTSLINQTYKNIEILAIDDGSPDNSKKIVSEFAKKENIKIVEKIVTKKQIIKERGEDVIKYINKEVVKYDSKCEIPEEFIKSLNDASQGLKE